MGRLIKKKLSYDDKPSSYNCQVDGSFQALKGEVNLQLCNMR